MDRRTFLRNTGFASAGLWLVACGKKEAPTANPKSLNGVIAGRQQNVSLISASDELLTRPEGDRFPFALFVPKTTSDHFEGGTARVWVAPDQTSDALGPFDATWHNEGIPERGIYVTRIPFPKDGAWLAFVEAKPERAVIGGKSQPASVTLLGGTTLAVGRRGTSPVPGDRAISVATPTFSQQRGVKPICTSKPFCSMHDQSLDVALKNGKPTVLIIGTPRFCTSRTCGPVNDIVDSVRKATGPSVNFVHIEVYKDDTDAPAKALLSPAASAWKLTTEPVVYFIGRDGVIKERFAGSTDKAEVAAQVRTLA